MKKIIRLIIIMIVFSFAVQMQGIAFAKSSKSIVCKQKYALCTSAPCVPIPGIKDKALCFCAVEDGLSLGKVACEKRKPVKNNTGHEKIISTFSLTQFKDKKMLTCPSGKAWTNCLDMPCLVDPTNPHRSLCTCQIMYTGAFATLGGNCDQKSCATTMWSAATPAQNRGNIKVMLKAQDISESQIKQCQSY